MHSSYQYPLQHARIFKNGNPQLNLNDQKIRIGYSRKESLSESASTSKLFCPRWPATALNAQANEALEQAQWAAQSAKNTQMQQLTPEELLKQQQESLELWCMTPNAFSSVTWLILFSKRCWVSAWVWDIFLVQSYQQNVLWSCYSVCPMRYLLFLLFCVCVCVFWFRHSLCFI